MESKGAECKRGENSCLTYSLLATWVRHSPLSAWSFVALHKLCLLNFGTLSSGFLSLWFRLLFYMYLGTFSSSFLVFVVWFAVPTCFCLLHLWYFLIRASLSSWFCLLLVCACSCLLHLQYLLIWASWSGLPGLRGLVCSSYLLLSSAPLILSHPGFPFFMVLFIVSVCLQLSPAPPVPSHLGFLVFWASWSSWLGLDLLRLLHLWYFLIWVSFSSWSCLLLCMCL